jgi:hypothetical protein
MHIDLLIKILLLFINPYIKHFSNNLEYLIIELTNKLLIEIIKLYLIHKFWFHYVL